MKKILFILFASSLLFAQGPVEEMFNGKYKKLHKNKAMAVAINEQTGAWAAGMSTNDGSLVGAKRVAMRFCRKYAKKSKVGAKCKIYAVNDKRVEEQ